ncbi:hypothetical protein HYPDE_27998 [Hyphomicrobium denitrificans 1NES1]|uniref:Uncharacterized protein n=1 Tax=Hyphomicrobium denitrificans 1NES1 TaxID=670307 RepID=N0B1B6_9HYPH|nr:hypothetical protein [Hyphomicrobium denitrificans]AGK57279.1 hypothetical protein HYPDE_27998 [Hyphomicrobium denitrificans 1NES1]
MVALVDGDDVVAPLGLDVLGDTVVFAGEVDVPEFVVVCAAAGIVTISIATAAEYIRESMSHVLQDSPFPA